jgi:hypothetical protein
MMRIRPWYTARVKGVDQRLAQTEVGAVYKLNPVDT